MERIVAFIVWFAEFSTSLNREWPSYATNEQY